MSILRESAMIIYNRNLAKTFRAHWDSHRNSARIELVLFTHEPEENLFTMDVWDADGQLVGVSLPDDREGFEYLEFERGELTAELGAFKRHVFRFLSGALFEDFYGREWVVSYVKSWHVEGRHVEGRHVNTIGTTITSAHCCPGAKPERMQGLFLREPITVCSVCGKEW
jgi:hypothetical protein